ncbi:hypothetical protein MWU59_09585 [Flavobacteriaceae bacterium F08102]|nr:hypothetical protein [Flavobacteriaceae bacterium F08102]
MEAKKKLTLTFYQKLGALFYAFAAIDNSIREEEIKKLKEFVKKKWLTIDELDDAFGTDAAYQIEIVFDWLSQQEHNDIHAYFDEFVAYKNEQKHFFTRPVKKLILETASAISESFSGKNKSELMLLAKLAIELKKE